MPFKYPEPRRKYQNDRLFKLRATDEEWKRRYNAKQRAYKAKRRALDEDYNPNLKAKRRPDVSVEQWQKQMQRALDREVYRSWRRDVYRGGSL